MSSRLLRAATCALAVSLAAGVAGCSSTSDKKTGASSSAPASATDRLAAAKKTFDTTSGVHLKLSSNDFPQSASGVIGGDGDGSPKPDFKGTLNAQLSGIQASIPVVATGGKVWAKLPIWPSMREIKPSDYNAPDPAKLFSADAGLSTLFVKTKDPKLGSQLRDGQDIVTRVTGALAGTDVVAVLAIGQTSQTYNVTYELTDDNRAVDIQLVGKFAGSTQSTYDLALSKYGQKVDVTAP